MNFFLFAWVACVTVVLFGIKFRWFALLSCFVALALLAGAFLTISPSRPRDKVDLVDGAEFSTLGAFKAIVYGFKFPTVRPLGFGDFVGVSNAAQSPDDANSIAGLPSANMAYIRVAGVPKGTATVEGNKVYVTSLLENGQLFSAKTESKQASALGFLRYEAPDGAVFCLADKSKNTCADADMSWELTPNGQLSITRRGESPSASVASCPFPTIRSDASDRIFPLENFGRPGCVGGALEELNFRDGAIPFVFLQPSKGGHFAVSAIPVASDEGIRLLVLHSGKPIAANDSTPLPLDTAAPVKLAILRVDISAPEWASAATTKGRSAGVEVGLSRLRTVLEFKIQHESGDNGVNTVLLNSPIVSTISPLDTCASPLNFVIAGHDDVITDPDVAGEFKIPLLSSMSEINGQGTIVSTKRLFGNDSIFPAGCSGFGRASFALSSPNGTIPDFAGGQALAIGDSANRGQLLLTIAEIGMPIWTILLVCLGAGLLRAAIRHRIMDQERHRFPAWALILLALADALLVIRLLSMLQELAYGNTEPHRFAQTLFLFALLPLMLELLVMTRFLGLPDRIQKRLSAGVAWVKGRVIQMASRAPKFAPPFVWLRVGFWLAVPVLHLLATALGFREKLLFGLSTTVVVMPLYALSFSSLFFLARQGQSWPGNGAFLESLMWIASMAIGAFAFMTANDTGAIFVYFIGPALLFGFEAVSAGRKERAAGNGRINHGTYWLLLLLTLALPVSVYTLLLLAVKLSPLVFWEEFIKSLSLDITGAGRMAAALLVLILLARMPRTPRQQMWLLPGVAALTILGSGIMGKDMTNKEVCPVELNALEQCYEGHTLSANAFRVAQMLMPTRIDESVSREGLGIKEVFAELSYLSDNWAGDGGKGFMAVYPRRSLNIYDNAPALHLTAPFGKWAVYCLMMTLAAVGLYAALVQSRNRDDAGALKGAVAMVIFCGASIYMLAANLQWVLFTGKNLYLTSTLSWSDLAEGYLMLAIALYYFPILRQKSDQPLPSP